MYSSCKFCDLLCAQVSATVWISSYNQGSYWVFMYSSCKFCDSLCVQVMGS
ncbi:hypothetical protein OIU74_003228 [Salix koriyanagi]|uniref:Uncharacterized protein n=1 Tax=Salix koriyanagi TaxID=2511006 RepID=A0A9Q0UY98_9ROSI|nr:hypothetical protein OIU74_003228 [Salix koriyanagi]